MRQKNFLVITYESSSYTKTHIFPEIYHKISLFVKFITLGTKNPQNSHYKPLLASLMKNLKEKSTHSLQPNHPITVNYTFYNSLYSSMSLHIPNASNASLCDLIAVYFMCYCLKEIKIMLQKKKQGIFLCPVCMYIKERT